MGALATIELTPQWRQLTAIRHKSSDDIRPECLQLLASGRGAMHIDYGYVGLVDDLGSSSAEHGAVTNMVSPAAAGIDQPSILKTDDAVSPSVHVPGSAAADIMFWWGLGTCAACPAACPAACDKDPAGWHRTAEANANISKSKFGQPSTSANGVTVSFSPFQIAYVVSTAAGASPLVRLITPPPWSSQNATQSFDSLLPLRKLGPLIVPITIAGRTSSYNSCNPDKNSSCLADLTALLTSAARRAAAIAELVAIAKERHFNGWNFDQESQMPSATLHTSPALVAGWRSFLTELAAAMTAVDPTSTVSVDICGCGGPIPLEDVSTFPDYMGMLPKDWQNAGVEAVAMCTYSNDSGKPYIQKGQSYNVFDERLRCLQGSYGRNVARVGLGQGIPTWNPDVSELKRQLARISAANLTKLAVFNVPSLYSSVEWLDVIYDWIAARKKTAQLKTDDPTNPSRLPLPSISFSDDEQHVTVIYNGTTRTVRRPVTPSWNYTVSGSTFWVSPSGSDTAAGTESAPLRTLFAAVNRTVAGDAVFLLPGVYVADRASSGHNEEGGKQHFIHRGGTADKPLVVSCAPGALGKVLLRADPTGDNKSLSTPILTIQGNYTTVNGLIMEGTAGLPNAPDCACTGNSQECAGMCHFVQVGVSVDLITGGTDILGVTTTNCVTYHNNHCGYKLPGHASWGPGTRSEWLLRGNLVFATGSGEFLGPHIVNAGLDHGFYMHANDGVVIDGNIGWGIASWGIHLYGGGHGANNSIVTRNILLGCRSGGCLITGHGSVVANNIFANSSSGMNLFRGPSPRNTFVNNLALWNQNDADVDDMGGKCYHPRPAWPQCGPFNNTGNHNFYSKVPTHCTEATGGKCTLTGKGCCTSGFPTSASDLLANGSWSTVLTQWDEGQEILDGRLSAGSPALGHAVPVQMPDGGLVPWLPAAVGFDLGPFQSASGG
jgi:hypothetical protein